MNKSPLPRLCLALLGVAGCATPVPSQLPPYRVAESTIASLHEALRTGRTSCAAVVRASLDRIEAYDQAGPALHAVIARNPAALAEARALDRRQAGAGALLPLHCVTLLVKDNIQVAGMPTTAGALAFRHNRPPGDAAVIARLRAAGAIVLAKANLDEFAFTYRGSSSLAGQTRNPYGPGLTPGGSSSGTASGINASYALVGIGTDTGGSGRVPAAVQALAGLRPTLGALSTAGVVPLAPSEDTVAPLCRTVADCARVFDVLTGSSGSTAPASLEGRRIGVLRQLFPVPATPEQRAFVAAIDAALARMRAAGAQVTEVDLPQLPRILATYKTVKPYEFRGAIEAYLAAWPADADGHPRSFEQLLASGGYEARNRVPLLEYAELGRSPAANPDYVLNATARLPDVRRAVSAALAGLDALLYPTRANFNLDADGTTSNNPATSRLASYGGLPALALPVAFVAPPGHPELGPQPVGVELLGHPGAEAALLGIGRAWEDLSPVRQPPPATP